MKSIKGFNVNKTAGWFFSVYRFVTLLCIGIILLYPVLNMLTIAIRPTEELADPLVRWIPKSLTFENLKTAWELMNFGYSALYGVIITLISTLLQIISCSMAGYGFARFRFKGRSLLFTIVLFTILVPPSTIIIPRYLQYFKFDFFGIGSIVRLFTGKTLSLNIIGTLWTLFIPASLGVGIRGGLFIYIFRQFFRGMPRELEDAAYIDGCGSFMTFIRVMIPGASVAFVTVAIFSIVWYWNDILNCTMYLSNLPNVSTKLSMLSSILDLEYKKGVDLVDYKYKIQNIEVNPFGLSSYIQAGCLLVASPLFIMYSFLQKYFTESIERTGIVG